MTKILDIKEVIIRKDKYSFAKGYTPIWSKEIFIITEVKNTLSWIYITID